MLANSMKLASIMGVGLLASVCLCACGGGAGIPAQSVSDSAHSIATDALTAIGDINICRQQPDGGACEMADKDICNILSTAGALDAVAIDAGFKPQDPVSARVAQSAAKTCPTTK
jgi:hypothetical protein